MVQTLVDIANESGAAAMDESQVREKGAYLDLIVIYVYGFVFSHVLSNKGNASYNRGLLWMHRSHACRVGKTA